MTTQNDTTALKGRVADDDQLFDAARAVKIAVRTAQAHDYPLVALENDGGYAEAPELQAALEKLCKVVDEVGARTATRNAANRDLEAAEQAKAIMAGDTIADALEEPELPEVTILSGDLIDALYGVHGIAQVLDRGAADNDRETLGLLASALLELTASLYHAMGSCPWNVKDALEGIAEVHQ